MRQIAFTVVVLLTLILMSCGGGSSSSTSTSPTVSLSPTTASIRVGQTQQFTATVKNTSNTVVTWEVNGVAGGDTTNGTVSTSGLYTAPTSVPSPASVTVTAVSQADTAQAASATVTVTVPVSIFPTTSAIGPSATLQFTATVTVSTNTAVTWQVNGITGGNSTVGTISTTGLYTAPAAVPNPNTVKITAVSQADTTQSASATVQITPPPLVISPAGATIAAGAQQAFTATALGGSVTPAWSIHCPSQLPDGCGSIASDGTYTAPLSPPPGGNVAVTATMTDASALTSTTNITVQFSNATLTGSYAFVYSNQTNTGTSAEAGAITFDGNGNITGGSSDASNNTGAIAITGGTYAVGVDGRGTATLQTASGAVTWQFVLTNHSQGSVARFDATGTAASGTLDLQQPAQFGLASLSGSYALSLSGGTIATPFAMVASLTADGAGNITQGLLDINNSSAVSTSLSGTGTYSAPSSAGRGTLTVSSSFGAQTFAYYQVDANHLKLVEIDGARIAGGDLVKQPAGPFTRANFSGRFAFTLSGASGGAPLGMGGVFTLDGSSGITNRVVDGANQTVFDTQGAYFVTDPASGRTTVNWTVNNGTILQYVLYPRNDGGFTMLEVDAINAAHGVVLPQTLSTPSVFSLTGGYSAGLAGTEPANGSSPESITGQMLLTGGAAFSGLLDVNDHGTVTQGAAVQVGAFVVDFNSGRGTATVLSSSPVLSGGNLVLYILDSDHALILETDSTRILTGAIARQF